MNIIKKEKETGIDWEEFTTYYQDGKVKVELYSKKNSQNILVGTRWTNADSLEYDPVEAALNINADYHMAAHVIKNNLLDHIDIKSENDIRLHIINVKDNDYIKFNKKTPVVKY